MSNSWEVNNCGHLTAYYEVYSVVKAAALWCGVPEDRVEQISKEARQLSGTGFGRGVWMHPNVPCLQARSRAIAEAIESGVLPHGREDGETCSEHDHVAYERRHIMGRHLREWLIQEFPNEKPAFLFDDIEQDSHTSISADAYRALKAEKDKLEGRLENAKTAYKELRDQRDQMQRELVALNKKLSGLDVPGERAEATYQNIIAVLLEVIAGRVPSIESHPSFSSEAKLIETIDQYYRGYPGLSKSNLQRKFPEAKRSLDDS